MRFILEVKKFFDFINSLDDLNLIIDDVYVFIDNESDDQSINKLDNVGEIEKVIFKVKDFYIVFSVNYDDNAMAVEVVKDFKKGALASVFIKDFMGLKGYALGSFYDIVNTNGFSDGLKITFYDPLITGSRHFFSSLTFFSSYSGLMYEFRDYGIDRYF
ncbi:hypothetical protein CTY88_12570 [Acinetobacter seifertii]|nr:hypothetical protein [Acinetobacter seifertii]